MVHKKIGKESRIVLVHGMGKKISGKKPVLLFSTTQIEEIIHAIDIHPVPFAPDYLLGVCLWRKQIIPVVDTFRRYGLQTQQTPRISSDDRYIVVNATGTVEGKKQLLQGVLKISKRIVTTEIPGSCSPVAINSYDIDKTIIKAVFEYQDDLLIVPNLASIFGSI
ncbi:MAG: chemotaxis protein CheW [Desulfobacterales bacterium]|nr:chemotaxis protein CheW [Desulfobacterales bacterium]